MTELEPVFIRLGLQQYLHRFLEEGFDTWETVLDITESDLDALTVKLGHRRRLQREIANVRGIAFEQLAPSTRPVASSEEQRHAESDDNLRSPVEACNAPGSSGKRKYRRHPKPDENAPERPPSAYVIFSSNIREDLKPLNLSFTEIAKRVGERWQILTPQEREPYESQAAAAKERFSSEMAKYKKTGNYRDYASYLADFKAKDAASARSSRDNSKRTKVEKTHGVTSTGSTLSSALTVLGSERHVVDSTPSIASASTNSPHASPLANVRPHHPLGAGHTSPPSLLPTPMIVDSSLKVERPSIDRLPDPVFHRLLPRILPLDSKEPLHPQPTLSPLLTEPIVPSLGSIYSARRSTQLQAPFLRHNSSKSSVSSTRSSTFSNEFPTLSTSSAGYTPITPIEEPRFQRELPIPVSAVSHTPISVPFSASHSPKHPAVPIQSNLIFGPTGPLSAPYGVPPSMDTPRDMKSLKNLSIASPSPEPRYRHQPGLQHPDCSPYEGHRIPTQERHQRRIHAPPQAGLLDLHRHPDLDALSVLALAGGMLDRDARRPP